MALMPILLFVLSLALMLALSILLSITLMLAQSLLLNKTSQSLTSQKFVQAPLQFSQNPAKQAVLERTLAPQHWTVHLSLIVIKGLVDMKQCYLLRRPG